MQHIFAYLVLFKYVIYLYLCLLFVVYIASLLVFVCPFDNKYLLFMYLNSANSI
jgi:hypothetical protein